MNLDPAPFLGEIDELLLPTTVCMWLAVLELLVQLPYIKVDAGKGSAAVL